MTELVVNGTFDTDTEGWSATNPTLSSVAGRLRVTSSGSGSQIAYQGFQTEPGRSYRLSGDVIRGTSSNALISVGNGPTSSSLPGSSPLYNGLGKSIVFVAANSTTYVRAQTNGSAPAGQYSEFDNLSVKLLPPRIPARSSFVVV